MANREELRIIRAARAGQASAQLALGKRYLFGGTGLPKSIASALYWLDRAAHQQQSDAWILIGSHIPFEIAQRAAQPSALCVWYERAYEAGVAQAGLVLAKLVLTLCGGDENHALRRKALTALKGAALAGIADAQWLLAQQIGGTKELGGPAAAREAADHEAPAFSNGADHSTLQWTMRAADGGIVAAQQALADHAWKAADYPLFLRWALPLARALARRCASSDIPARQLSEQDTIMLARCAQALLLAADLDANEVTRFLELAAQAGYKQAQFSLGLWLAKIDANGARIDAIPGSANYKKAIRWLTLAGEQGLGEAWYALSKIYLKAEFSQRNVSDAQCYLEHAAEAGHCSAQLELGSSAWRARRAAQSNDVRALYWLQKAVAQGSADAQAMVKRIAADASPAAWAQAVQRRLTRETINVYPFLAARIELAAQFGLSQPEALLVDVNAADCGHCLLLDIRELHARSKRRLIQVQTGEERQALNRIARLFEDVDCGPSGPEGNYRQRLYRLRTLSARE